MVQVSTIRRRSWVGMAWLVIGVAAVLVALGMGNTAVALAVLFVALLGGGLVLLRSQEAAPATVPAPAISAAGVARAQRSVVMADSTPRQALVVPAEAADGYQTVLTINGYALVNAEGRVVLALSRGAPAPANEPVVVTIVDAA